MHRTIAITATLATAVTMCAVGAPAQAQTYQQIYSFPGGRNGSVPTPAW